MDIRNIIISRLEQIKENEINFSDEWWNKKTIIINKSSGELPISKIDFNSLDDFDIVKVFEIITGYVMFKNIKSDMIEFFNKK